MARGMETVRRAELRSPKYLEAYLRDHYRKGPEEFRIALREAVLSQEGGFIELSRRTGLARTGLYKALSAKGNPSYRTVQQILDALGVSITLALKASATRRPKKMQDLKTYIIPEKQGSKGARASVVPEAQKGSKTTILPGSGKGLFVMANDFDAPLPEFREFM